MILSHVKWSFQKNFLCNVMEVHRWYGLRSFTSNHICANCHQLFLWVLLIKWSFTWHHLAKVFFFLMYWCLEATQQIFINQFQHAAVNSTCLLSEKSKALIQNSRRKLWKRSKFFQFFVNKMPYFWSYIDCSFPANTMWFFRLLEALAINFGWAFL